MDIVWGLSLVGPLAEAARDVDGADEVCHDGGGAGEGVDGGGEAVAVHGEVLHHHRRHDDALQLLLVLPNDPAI